MIEPLLSPDLVAEPAAPAMPEEQARPRFALTAADLRFFAACYLGGLLFFLVMLS